MSPTYWYIYLFLGAYCISCPWDLALFGGKISRILVNWTLVFSLQSINKISNIKTLNLSLPWYTNPFRHLIYESYSCIKSNLRIPSNRSNAGDSVSDQLLLNSGCCSLSIGRRILFAASRGITNRLHIQMCSTSDFYWQCDADWNIYSLQVNLPALTP